MSTSPLIFGDHVTRKKRTEITIATREVIVIRGAKSVVRNWCAECDAEVGMATAEKAAAISGLSTRAIYRQIECGQIHFIETGSGLLVCLRNL